MSTSWTGVGSQETPQDLQTLMFFLGFEFSDRGRVFRSGHARGADTFFEEGVIEYATKKQVQMPAQIFLPQPNFNRTQADGKVYFHIPEENPIYQEAMDIAKRVHPAWNKCNDFARRAHTRNAFQVLGPNLDDPSDYLVCWSIPALNGKVSGGTNTAWCIAHEFGVKCYNLYHEAQVKKALDFLEITQQKYNAMIGK